LKTLRLFVLFSILFLFVGGCKKYPDGPVLSLRTRKHRLCENWKRVKEYENGTDITPQVMPIIYSESRNIFTDGSFSYNLVTNNGTVSYSGSWSFSTDQTIVFFSYYAGATPVNDAFLILRLKEGDLWMQNTAVTGDVYQYHFAPN